MSQHPTTAHLVSSLLAPQAGPVPFLWPFLQSPLFDGLWFNPFLPGPPPSFGALPPCLPSPKSPPKPPLPPKPSPQPTHTDPETSQSIEAVATSLGRTDQGYKCIYCQKIYSRKYGLKIHLRTHTGFKPLKCKICSRAFSDPSNLNKHTRLHAEQTAVRCKICGKGAARGRDLERHMLARHPELVEDFKDLRPPSRGGVMAKMRAPRRLSLGAGEQAKAVPDSEPFLKRHSMDPPLGLVPFQTSLGPNTLAGVPQIPTDPIPKPAYFPAISQTFDANSSKVAISTKPADSSNMSSDCDADAEIDVVSV